MAKMRFLSWVTCLLIGLNAMRVPVALVMGGIGFVGVVEAADWAKKVGSKPSSSQQSAVSRPQAAPKPQSLTVKQPPPPSAQRPVSPPPAAEPDSEEASESSPRESSGASQEDPLYKQPLEQFRALFSNAEVPKEGLIAYFSQGGYQTALGSLLEKEDQKIFRLGIVYVLNNHCKSVPLPLASYILSSDPQQGLLVPQTIQSLQSLASEDPHRDEEAAATPSSSSSSSSSFLAPIEEPTSASQGSQQTMEGSQPLTLGGGSEEEGAAAVASSSSSAGLPTPLNLSADPPLSLKRGPRTILNFKEILNIIKNNYHKIDLTALKQEFTKLAPLDVGRQWRRSLSVEKCCPGPLCSFGENDETISWTDEDYEFIKELRRKSIKMTKIMLVKDEKEKRQDEEYQRAQINIINKIKSDDFEISEEEVNKGKNFALLRIGIIKKTKNGSTIYFDKLVPKVYGSGLHKELFTSDLLRVEANTNRRVSSIQAAKAKALDDIWRLVLWPTSFIDTSVNKEIADSIKNNLKYENKAAREDARNEAYHKKMIKYFSGITPNDEQIRKKFIRTDPYMGGTKDWFVAEDLRDSEQAAMKDVFDNDEVIKQTIDALINISQTFDALEESEEERKVKETDEDTSEEVALAINLLSNRSTCSLRHDGGWGCTEQLSYFANKKRKILQNINDYIRNKSKTNIKDCLFTAASDSKDWMTQPESTYDWEIEEAAASAHLIPNLLTSAPSSPTSFPPIEGAVDHLLGKMYHKIPQDSLPETQRQLSEGKQE